MTNEDMTLKLADSPVTRPGFHVTPEGRMIGASLEDFDVTWEGPEDSRLTEVEGIPVVESKGGGAPPSHPDERHAFVSPQMQEDLRKDAGLPPNGVDGTPGAPGVSGEDGGVDPGAAAPAVTTSVDGQGRKATVEHNLNVEGDLTEAGREALRKAAKEAERSAKRLNTR